MKNLANYAILCFIAFILTACSPTQPQYVDSSEFISFGLDNHDISNAIKKISTSLLNNAKIKKLKEAKVLAIGAIDDESDMLIDTELIASELVQNLNDSTRFIVVNAGRDKKVEQILKDSRKMRENKEYNQYTTIEQGELIAPHYALTGKITQKNRVIKSDEIVEYIFTFTLTDLSRGATQWIGNAKISKKLTKDEVGKFGGNSVGFDNSVTKIRKDFFQRLEKKKDEVSQIYLQNYEYQIALSKCRNNKNKAECKKVVDFVNSTCYHGQNDIQKADACSDLAQYYLMGSKELQIAINKDEAIKYANIVCRLDGTFCTNIATGFYLNHKDKTIALRYYEQACELGEPLGCGFASGAYSGIWERKGGIKGIKKDIKRARYYKAKVCEAGYKDFCR